MEITGAGKSPSSALSFRYNANNEELEELFSNEDEVPPEVAPVTRSESASPKKGDKDKTPSILDKYFKSIRSEKADKADDPKIEETRTPPKEVSSSPMKDYLNRFGKRSVTSEGSPEAKEGSNETWKLFHDFKSKITQAVEDMKSKSQDEREKSVPRENSVSDSEENSAPKDSDQQSVGDTDNQVSSLDSSMQNLSDVTQPLTARVTEREQSLPSENKNVSDSSDDTHKNLVYSPSVDILAEPYADDLLDVESGVEALEDIVDATMGNVEDDKKSNKNTPVHTVPHNISLISSLPDIKPPSVNKKAVHSAPTQKTYFFTFTLYFLTMLVILNVMFLQEAYIWKGFVIGLWCFYVINSFYLWVFDNLFGEEPARSLPALKKGSLDSSSYLIPSVKEHTPIKKFECWVNHYRYREYDPFTYHVNRTATAFMKLEGCNLRISYTRQKIPKRALWNEKIENIVFYQHRLYNLLGAKVVLLPKGLVSRRLWSKKYPVCVILSDKEQVQVLERETPLTSDKKFTESLFSDKKFKDGFSQHDVDTNTTPEKRRKFIWRKREKSISRSSEEVGREGLRQRLARKIHKEKKLDNVIFDDVPEPCTDSIQNDDIFHEAVSDVTKLTLPSKEDEDDIFEDTELTKILEEEPEAEHVEGEWSIHTKSVGGLHLFLFGRTGRDKLELFRRLAIAITEANSEPASEEKSASENTDNKDNSSFKLADKDTVSFNKSPKTTSESTVTEGVTINTTPCQVPSTIASSEKNFWPYLIKIIQEKAPPGCNCRTLPSEMTWLNTMMARMMYDIMKNDAFISKLQNRIQRKLHTMKLPSFMSPLLVTELNLSGACPQIEWVTTPSWDERGIWMDADLRYEGGAYIAILTQINLMKLKQKNVTLEELTQHESHHVEDDTTTTSSVPSDQMRKLKPAIYDSDAEDSAESSSDDESPPVQPVDSAENIVAAPEATTPEGSSKKRFLRMVDKLATNKYFQQVTDYKYVKRAMEGLSHTDIKLQVDLQAIDGRVTLNLPPPPHDRVWIGFRTNPQLVLKARPAVGARTLRFAHISNWIEQKLSKEFEKVLVLPNLEDILLEFMTPTPTEVE